MVRLQSLAAALLAVAAVAGGSAACAQAVAPPPACARGVAGQPELKPLQPLTLVTEKGRFALKVELADTAAERDTGMMCRRSMAADRGMLFDFGRPVDGVSFWMRNTIIPLDIIYIRPDGRVLSIARNARPLDETPLPAGGRVRGVLELPGGRAAQIGLMPGDQVLHRIFPK